MAQETDESDLDRYHYYDGYYHHTTASIAAPSYSCCCVAVAVVRRDFTRAVKRLSFFKIALIAADNF